MAVRRDLAGGGMRVTVGWSPSQIKGNIRVFCRVRPVNKKELQESPDGLVTLRDDLPGNRALYGTLSKLVVFQVRALQDLQKQLMEIKSYR